MTSLAQRLRHGAGWRLGRCKEKLRNSFKRHFGSDDERRSSWCKYISNIARKNNLYVYVKNLVWLHDSEFRELRNLQIPGIPDDRLFFLYSTAQAVAELDGNIAECGVRAGKSSFAILKGFGNSPEKSMHLFDSFEGISEPTEPDHGPDGRTPWEKGALAYSEEQVRENLAPFGSMIRIHRGWIPDRFHEVDKEKFCFVHIDVDLFEPTKDSIRFFYDRIVPNGVLICDDYGSRNCPGAKRAVDDFFAEKPEHVFHLPSGQCLVVKV